MLYVVGVHVAIIVLFDVILVYDSFHPENVYPGRVGSVGGVALLL